MLNGKLNLGLIGVGRIGKVHGEHIAYRIPRARLAAISDVNVNEAKAVGGRLGINKIEADHHVLLDDPEIDAVVICSPTDMHAVMIEEAASAGKHIFCSHRAPSRRLTRRWTLLRAGVKLQMDSIAA